jgi:polyhydroxyalkanoate synthesis regulator phasin
MARDERLKKAQAAGADFIETARDKAEDFLKELAKTGGETQSALDDLVAGGRKTGEQLVSAISKEIRNQVNALGLVTRIDLQALEARLTGRTPATRSSAPARPSAAGNHTAGSKPAAAKAPSSAKASSPAKTPAAKTPAAKTPAAKTPAAKTPAAKTPAARSGAAKGAAGKAAATPAPAGAKAAAKKAPAKATKKAAG